jgi:hypothetical protein
MIAMQTPSYGVARPNSSPKLLKRLVLDGGAATFIKRLG